MESILKHGREGLPEAMAHLVDEAMEINRSPFMEAAPYERTSARNGCANGFKDKGLNTRLGELTSQVPQVRELPQDREHFYPRALKRGSGSD